MHGKKYRAAKEHVVKDKALAPKEALSLVKQLSFARFDESVDVNVNLGIDPSKGEQVVRGAVILPHKIGKDMRIVVFAKGDYADQAKNAGAEFIGAEDLVEKIEQGWMDFDLALATPDLMGLVSKLAKQLGPRGLLPNKKLGTVTFDLVPVINDLKKGKAFFKNDKSGLVHFRIGKVSFSVEQLVENFSAFIKSLNAARPSMVKGSFVKKITASSTMGPGIHVQQEVNVE